MPKSRMNKRKNKGGLKFGDTGPGAGTVLYHGPSRLPSSVDPEIKTVELHASQVASYTAAAPAVLDFNITSSTVRTIGSDFSSWAALYREYRVLAIRCEFIPTMQDALPLGASGFATPFNLLPLWTVIDRDDVSTVGSYANVVSNTSLRIYPCNRCWMREAKMASTEEADFVAVSTNPLAFFTIKVFSTASAGAAIAVTLGHLYYTYVVQFRTRI